MRHDYLRPSWDCGLCMREWPCAPAKVELAERYPEQIELDAHMTRLMLQAANELPLHRCKSPELRDRFVTWTEKRPAPRRHR